MSCSSCGHENRPDARFCAGCGAMIQVDLDCPSCGRRASPGARFCDGCGQGLESGVPSEGTERAPRDYTPKHLAERILQSKSALEGERKQVTVLFADVKGSMELAEQLGPEDWRGILERFFEITSEGVHRFEGTVNQYLGDGIMALFGAPLAHEDHAQRACYAALHLRDELRRYADELRVSRGLNLSVRMGLNSGEVIVGKIGDDLRMDYTAQGHAVGLAQRMEQLAESGCVYLSRDTAKLVDGYFELRALGEARVQGARERVGIFELKDVGSLHTRLDVARSRGLSRFVGRQDEMATLEAAFSRALEGHGQIVGVVAPAGVGKSRLCTEFVEACRAKGIRVIDAHCPAHGKTIPFLPIFELLRNLFAIEEQDSDDEARRKIAGSLVLLDEAFQDSLSLIFDFLGVPDPQRPAPEMSPDARQHQLFAFVRQLVVARSRREPEVVFIDDLHWIDAASDAFVATLNEVVEQTRTLVLVNFRPEYEADWTRRSYYQQLPLTPLGPDAVHELVRGHLGDDPSVSGLSALIQSRAEGNPFFTEEILQALIEGGQLEGSSGAYRLTTPVQQLQVPPTVQAVLGARIDRLGEREKQVLQAASVIGREFTAPVLAEVAGLPEVDLAAALSALDQAEFIMPRALYPVAEYRFKHPLTQAVALDTQLSERRGRLHAAAAGAVEAQTPSDRLDEQAALIAYHLQHAGEVLSSARWHARAARYFGVTDPSAGLRHWETTRDLARTLDDDDEARELQLEACQSILGASWRVAMNLESAEALLEEGFALAHAAGDREAPIALHLGYASVVMPEPERALEHCLTAESLVGPETDPCLALDARWESAYSRFSAGRMPEAFAGMEAIVAEVERDGDPGAGIYANYHHAMSLMIGSLAAAWHGRIAEARAYCTRAIERGRQESVEHHFRDSLGWSLAAAGGVAFFAGEHQNAAAPDFDHVAAQVIEIAEESATPHQRISMREMLCLGLLALGRAADARDLLQDALSIIRDGSESAFEGGVLGGLSLALTQLGELDAALEHADEVVEKAERRKARAYAALGHFARAQALMARGSPTAASEIERALDRSQAYAEAGVGGFIPKIEEARARLARTLGSDHGFAQRLREAHRLYAEMGATGHAERLARELHG